MSIGYAVRPILTVVNISLKSFHKKKRNILLRHWSRIYSESRENACEIPGVYSCVKLQGVGSKVGISSKRLAVVYKILTVTAQS